MLNNVKRLSERVCVCVRLNIEWCFTVSKKKLFLYLKQNIRLILHIALDETDPNLNGIVT